MDKVLIVDDDEALRKLFSIKLQEYKDNFVPVFAGNVEEAINILAQENILLLVTDLIMPEVDGFVLLSHMSINYPTIPCIVMTAYVIPGLEKRLSQSIFHFLKKPVNPAALAELIMQGLGQENQDGVLSGISLPGLMQLIEAEKKTCLLSISTNKEKYGLIYFCDGEIYDALCGDLKGEKAAIKLIAMDDVQVHHQKLPLKRISRRIELGIQPLILAAMKFKDEAAATESTKINRAELSQKQQNELLNEGKALCEGLYFKKAQKPLMKLVQNYPENAQGWLWLSRTLSNMKQLHKALTKASSIDAQNSDIENDILKYYAAAKVCGEQIHRCHFCYAPIEPKSTHCHYCKSFLVITKKILPRIGESVYRKELRLAVKRYEEVLSRELNSKIIFYAGLACLHLNDFDNALQYFEQLPSCVGNEESIYTEAVKHIVGYIASKQVEKKSVVLSDQGEESSVLSDVSDKKKVFVVEDSPTTRKIIKIILHSNGFQVVDEAADGVEALSKLNDIRPDLILLDVMLPKLDGYSILSVLKQNDALRHVPVIMLTSKDSFKDKLKGRFSSASAYLTKPFKADELIRQANKYIQ